MITDGLVENAEEVMERRGMPHIAFDTHDEESLSSLLDEARWKHNLKHRLHLVDDNQVLGGLYFLHGTTMNEDHRGTSIYGDKAGPDM